MPSIFVITVLVLAILIFVCNLIIVVTIFKSRYLQVPNIVFVAGMALADLLAGLIGLPLLYIARLETQQGFGTCYFFSMTYLYLGDGASVYMLVGFTLDRLFAIRFPFKYHSTMDVKAAVIFAGILWLLALFATVVPSFIMDPELSVNYAGTCLFPNVLPMTYLADFRFYLVIITLGVLITVNSYIIYTVMKHKKNIARTSITSSNNLYTKKKSRAELQMLSMISAFIICRLPVNIMLMFSYHHGVSISVQEWQPLLLLHFSNPLVNAMIYAYSNKNISREIKNCICLRPVNQTAPTPRRHHKDFSGRVYLSRKSIVHNTGDSPRSSLKRSSAKDIEVDFADFEDAEIPPSSSSWLCKFASAVGMIKSPNRISRVNSADRPDVTFIVLTSSSQSRNSGKSDVVDKMSS